jgi:hypothetical protein
MKASHTGAEDQFGLSVAINSDGNTLAIGAPFEDSSIVGTENAGTVADTNESTLDSGALYLFIRSGSTWSQQAYMKASNTGVDDQFGRSVAISSNGNTLGVGASFEDSNTTGTTNAGTAASTNELSSDSGAIYLFIRSGTAWSQQAYIKGSNNTQTNDRFGVSIAVGGSEGDTLAVGATLEDSSTTGINTTPNESASDSGATYLFTRSGVTWSQQAYIKGSNTDGDDKFGGAVSLSGDGNRLAVGAAFEDSSTTGMANSGTPESTNESATDSGAVYLFTRSGTTWSQKNYIKASDTETGDQFGTAVSLAGDTNGTLAAGADGEGSNATGVNGSQTNNASLLSGAVYLY